MGASDAPLRALALYRAEAAGVHPFGRAARIGQCGTQKAQPAHIMRARSMLKLLRLIPLGSVLAAMAWSAAPGAIGTQQPIRWRTQWNQSLFAEAAREHRFVLLDLHAVWCHWCHVMDETTYADPSVRALIDQHYVPVGIDADDDPGLARRYGDWGWPATIVLAGDGACT